MLGQHFQKTYVAMVSSHLHSDSESPVSTEAKNPVTISNSVYLKTFGI